MKKYVLYMHAGSLNRGCEAIVRSTCKILANNTMDTCLFSHRPAEDVTSKLNLLCTVKKNRQTEIGRFSFARICSVLATRLFHNYYFRYPDLIGSVDVETVALSIGGDNYCYQGGPIELASLNNLIKKRGAKTVLWGCSIEPDSLDEDVIEDLKQYDLITPRESITYQALMAKGINKNTQLFPDPAFQLDKVELPLPPGFVENHTVGINVSPLIMKLEKGANITAKNYSNLVQHIINTTDMQIALVPHVLWDGNNDMEPLQALYEEFKDTGRVVLLGGQYNSMELKGFIARCRLFVGARTHATIAAYSTCVPTLVVGYSVKARGIARDIFGTEDHMVIPVQSLEQEDDLVQGFIFLQEHEEQVKQRLQDIMPSYIGRAWLAGVEVKKLVKK